MADQERDAALLSFLVHQRQLLAQVHAETMRRLEAHPERDQEGFAVVAEEIGAQVREALAGPQYDAQEEGLAGPNWLDLPEL